MIGLIYLTMPLHYTTYPFELRPLIEFMLTSFDNQINCPLNATSYGCCKGLEKPCMCISAIVNDLR